MRTTVAAAVACVIAISLSHAEETHAAIKKDTNIPAQGLGPALRDLAKERDFQIVYVSEDVNGRHTSGATGPLTTQEALTKLLDGTGLAYRHLDDKTITVYPVAATGDQPHAGTQPAPTVSERTKSSPSTAAAAAPSSGVEKEVPKSFWKRLRLAQAQARDTTRTSEAGATDDSSVPRKLTLEEVVVTAQRREQTVKDIPFTITAVTGAELEKTRIEDIEGLAETVPGLAVQNFSKGNKVYSIRGISSIRGQGSLTGVYIDDVSISSSLSANSPDLGMEDLARIEVLKGPQGTLFGEGSTGGTIRYITNDPELDGFEAALASSYSVTKDGDPGFTARGFANVPIVEGKLAVRVAGAYQDNGGWIDKVATLGQPTLAEDINSDDMRSGRIKVLFQPFEQLSILAMAATGEYHADGPDGSNIGRTSDHQYRPAVDPNRVERTSYDYDIYSLSAKYDLGFADLLSVTSKVQGRDSSPTSQQGFIDGGSYLEFGADEQLSERSDFSQEIRLTSTKSDFVSWTVGGFYKDAEREAIAHPQGITQLAFNGILAGTFPNAANKDQAKTKAVFGDLSVHPVARLEIGAGLRYSEEDKNYYVPTNKAATYVADTYDKLTYRIYGSLDVTAGVKLFANRSTGFRSGQFNTNAVILLGAPVQTLPESVVSHELGIKGDLFEKAARFELALFHQKYTDVINTAVLLIGNQFHNYNGNPGDATVKGVEGSLIVEPSSDWLFGFNGDVIDASYTKVSTDLSVAQVYPGDHLDMVPEYSFSVFTERRFAMSGSAAGTLRLEWNRQGPRHCTVRNFVWLSEEMESNPSDSVNVRFDVSKGDWDVGVFVQNLTDEADDLNGFLSNWTNVPRPLNGGIHVRRSF